MEFNIESSNSNELNLELNSAISDFHEEEKDLKEAIKKEDNLRNTYKRINFHYDTSVFPKGWRDIILKMKKSDVDKNSLEWALLKNEQIQHLYATILSSHIQSRNERLERVKKEENRSDWDIYSENESTPEKFEEFLLSEEWMQVLMDEINRHLDENGQTYDNYKITSEVLELKLRTSRFDKIYRDFNLEYLVNWVDEKENRMRQYVNSVLNNVDDSVWNYLKKWWDKRWKWLLRDIDWLFNSEENWFSIDELQESDFSKDELRWLLKNKIQRYAGRILKLRKKENIGQYLWNTELDLQLKSYLYIYGKFFYPEEFKKPWYELPDYESTLLEIFEAILYYDGKLEEVKNNKFIEKEKQAENARKKRVKLRIQEIAKRNRERNERAQSLRRMDKLNIGEVQTKSIDLNSATWPEIAAEANLWEKLSNYNLNIQESEEKQIWKKEVAFHEAWKGFIQLHDDIKSIITQESMRRLFDINKNMINNERWKTFVQMNPILKNMPNDEINNIHVTLSSFSSFFANKEEKLSNNSSELKKKVNETVKTHAIWAVIDNVRDTFDAIPHWQNQNSEWFKFSKFQWNETPVEINWNDLFISGSFNGTDVKVRYDLNTWELFMNSFLNKLPPDKVSIWANSSMNYPDFKIWEIKKFNLVLNDYYKLPTHSSQSFESNNKPMTWGSRWNNSLNHQEFSNKTEQDNSPALNETPQHKPSHKLTNWYQYPKNDKNNLDSRRAEAQELLNSQIGLISEVIKTKTESQAHKNLAINKFMKTFNVISDSWQFSSWDFNKWSNLYDLIDIIENTGDINNGNIQALEYFNNTFMPKVMEYSWLKWGERNEYQNKTKEKSEKIFNYGGDNENIKFLRDKTKDFNPSQFSWVANFESSHQLWFADLIKAKIVTWSDVNRKLDISKMEQFIKDIETVDKEADTKLDEQLASIN